MSIFELYLLTRLDTLHSFFTLISILTMAALVVLGMATCVFWEESHKMQTKAALILSAMSLSFGLLACFTPTNKDLAVIFAGHWATNSEEVRELPDNVVRTMNKFMSDYNKTEKEISNE